MFAVPGRMMFEAKPSNFQSILLAIRVVVGLDFFVSAFFARSLYKFIFLDSPRYGLVSVILLSLDLIHLEYIFS